MTTGPTAALYPCPRSRSVGPLRTLRPDPDLGRHSPRGEPFGRASRPSRPGRQTARAAIGPLARGGHRGLPALARPGSAQVQVPDFWQPEGVSGQAGPAGPAITMVAECSLMPMSGHCTYSSEFLRLGRRRSAMLRNEAVDNLVINSVPGRIPEPLFLCVSQDFR